MRDPSVLDPQIRAYLEAENAYTKAALDDTSALQAALFAEMKARIKEDDSSVPTPGRAVRVFRELRHRRPVSALEPASARRRPRAGPHRRQQGGRGQALLAARRRGAQPRPPLSGLRASTTRARSCSPSASATWRPARTCPTPSPTRAAPSSGRATAARCSTSGSTTTIARCSSTGTASARPPHEDVLVYEEKDIGFYVGVGQTQSGRFIIIDAHDHQTNEAYLIDADRPESALRLVAAARARPRVFGGPPRRPAVHHDELRRRGGLPHLRGARRRPAAWRTGARSCRTSPAA